MKAKARIYQRISQAADKQRLKIFGTKACVRQPNPGPPINPEINHELPANFAAWRATVTAWQNKSVSEMTPHELLQAAASAYGDALNGSTDKQIQYMVFVRELDQLYRTKKIDMDVKPLQVVVEKLRGGERPSVGEMEAANKRTRWLKAATLPTTLHPVEKALPVRRKKRGQYKPRPLTNQQTKALELFAKYGYDIPSIARDMGISRATAKQHLDAALSKLPHDARPIPQEKLTARTQRLPRNRRGQADI